MFALLLDVDKWLLGRINGQWIAPWLDAVMALVTDFDFWKFPLAAGATALAVWGGKKGQLFLLMSLLAVGLGETINGSVKRWTDRPRPHESWPGVRRVDRHGVTLSTPGPVEKGRSLPSNHVANNAAVALLLIRIFGPRAKWAWLWVVVLSYSRIYTGSHYPSDVLASIALALLYTSFLIWLAEQLWSTSGARWAPQLFQRKPKLFYCRTDP